MNYKKQLALHYSCLCFAHSVVIVVVHSIPSLPSRVRIVKKRLLIVFLSFLLTMGKLNNSGSSDSFS